MAIHCLDPNKMGAQTEEMFNVTNTSGRNLVTSFGATIENLKSHWKGSDAVSNLTDLARVYTAVTDLVKDLVKGVLRLVGHLLKMVYLIVQWFNNLIAKLFLKLPRLVRVIIIYLLIASFVFTILVLTKNTTITF